MIKILEPKRVAFNSNGGSYVSSQSLFKGQPVKRPTDPVKSGNDFTGWYQDNNTFNDEWNFNTIPIEDITLYARWVSSVDHKAQLITSAAITMTGPATGEIPGATASGSGNFTIGEVSWSPEHDLFMGDVQYTVTVTLMANQDHTFASTLTAATVNGNNAEVTNNTGNTLTLSYTFAKTDTRAVTGISIKTQPTLEYTHGDRLDLSALVAVLSYDNGDIEDVPFAKFDSKNISENPAHGEELVRSVHNGHHVTVSIGVHSAGTGTLTVSKADPVVTWPSGLTAVFGQKLSHVILPDGGTDVPGNFAWTKPADDVGSVGTQSHKVTFTPRDAVSYNTLTHDVTVTVSAAPISSAAITVTGPAKGETPDAVASGSVNFTIGEVSWSPNDNPFRGEVQYTATVTLTANANYTFTKSTTASINGLSVVISNNTGTAVTLSHKFAATDAREITGISIKTQPALEYTHGDKLDLSALAAVLSYDIGNPEDVPFAKFDSKNISENPANNTPLIHTVHDGKAVTVSIGIHHADTGKLTVNKKTLTVTGAAHTKQYDGGTAASGVVLTLDGIVSGDHVSATVAAVYTNANAGTKTINITGGVTLTGTSAANYTVTPPTGTFTVEGITKADGAEVSQPTVTGDPSTLSVTVSSELASNTGQSVEYAINTTNSAPTDGWQASNSFTLSINTKYYVFARSASNDNYNAGTPSAGTEAAFYNAGITLEIEDIVDGAPLRNDNITLSQSGANKTQTITVADPSAYSNIEWKVTGVGDVNEFVTGDGASFELDANNEKYGTIGGHTLMLTVYIDGNPYMVNIRFTINP